MSQNPTAHSPASGNRSQNVVVFGSGLIGLCTAFSLMRAGHKVTVVEKDTVGSGAARGNAGEITPLQALPMPEPKLLTEIFRGVFSRKHYLSIAPLALPVLSGFGLNFIANCTPKALKSNTEALDQLVRGAFAAFDEYHRDGISLGGGGFGYLNSHTSVDALREFRDFQVARADHLGTDRPGEIMLDAELHDYEPVLDEHVRAGFVAQTERFIDPNLFVDELHGALIDNGAEIFEHTELKSISNTSAIVITDDGERSIDFEKAIVATGAWTTGKISGLPGITTSFVTAGTGYSFHADIPQLPKHLLHGLDRKTIGIPMSGSLRVVGLMDFSSEISDFKDSRIEHMRGEAAKFIKGVADAEIYQEWSGPRPMTPTGLPIISPVKNAPNVIVATGHNMHGLSLGPVTGEVVTSMVEGKPGVVAGAEVDMRPFAL